MTNGAASQGLFMAYTAVTLAEMIFGMFLVVRTCMLWRSVYHRLTPVVRSYILVYVPDVVIVVVYFIRSIYGLATGHLIATDNSEWSTCRTALLLSAALVTGAVAPWPCSQATTGFAPSRRT
jgi:hypothetical protein